MTTPRMLSGSSPEDDPTGVRALLSSLPDPGPMPTYLVERISASLAAEQAQRTPADPLVVTPLAARRSRRSAPRMLLAIAGAAAVAVVGIVGTNLLSSPSSTTGAGAALSAATSEAATGGDNSDKSAGAEAATPELQITQSSTDYREAGFAEQARALTASPVAWVPASPPLPSQPTPDRSGAPIDSQSGPLAAAAGVRDCLIGLGLTRADLVVADLATYDGRPAVVIVATRAGTSTAYVVGRDCNRTTPSLLRAAVPLP